MTQRIHPAARATALGAATLAAVLLLGACGGGHGDGPAHPAHSARPAPGATGSAAAHNAQDAGFARQMIPHHRQAVEMARLAAGRASSARVKDLAARIEKAQAPEIRTMSGWLTAWGEKVPTAAGTDHAGHDGTDKTDGMDGMEGMDGTSGTAKSGGMMSAAAMERLAKSKGAAFDSAFLSLMIEHHQGALDMATAERARGRYAPATRLAGRIIAGQSAEIKEMKQLLGDH